MSGEAPLTGCINPNHGRLEFPAPCDHLRSVKRSNFLSKLPSSDGDCMKALLRTTDIHTDHGWNRITVTNHGPCLAANASLVHLLSEVIRNQPKLFESGFEVVDDFLGNHAGSGR